MNTDLNPPGSCIEKSTLNPGRSKNRVFLEYVRVEEVHLYRLFDDLCYRALRSPNLVSNQERHVRIPLHEIPFVAIDISEQADDNRDGLRAACSHDPTRLDISQEADVHREVIETLLDRPCHKITLSWLRLSPNQLPCPCTNPYWSPHLP